MIDIIPILQDGPEGTLIFSPIFGDVTYDGIDTGLISVDANGEPKLFNADGTFSDSSGAECLLFPSKEVRQWNYYNVYFVRLPGYIDEAVILKAKKLLEEKGGKIGKYELDIKQDALWYIDAVTHDVQSTSIHCCPYGPYILSTGRILELDEEERFNIGDVVKVNDNLYIVSAHVGVNRQLPYTLTQNILSSMPEARLATEEEIDIWNDSLHSIRKHYSKSKKKAIPWFKEFDHVVVRNFDPDSEQSRNNRDSYWFATDFSHYNKKNPQFPYVCTCHDSFAECLPYNEKTRKLIGTTDVWEEE